MVELAVGGYLSFFQRIESHHVEVVVANKSHHLSIGREGGEALLALHRDALHGAIGNAIDIIAAHAAMTVDRLELGTEKDFLLVLRELIRLDGRHGLYLLAHGVGEGTHHTHLFTSLIAVLLDARTGPA